MTRHDLDELKELHRERKWIEERIEELRASVERTSPNLDGMPHSGQQRDIMAEYAANYTEALGKLSGIEKRVAELIDEIEYWIRDAGLPAKQTAIIWMKYAEGKSIGQIGKEMYYGRQWVYKQYRQAMQTLFPKK